MRRSRIILVFLILGLCCIAFFAISGWVTAIPTQAEVLFGPPADSLSPINRWRLAWSLVENVDHLTLPVDPAGDPQTFVIEPGEAAPQVIDELFATGLIRSKTVFRDYLVYTGADTRLVPGTYSLSPRMAAIDIAVNIQNIEATGVTFVLLPGWRIEEIAASLPTTGLNIDPESFLAAARRAPTGGASAIWPSDATHEGLLFPDTYTLPRNLSAEALIGILTENFRAYLKPEIQAGFERQGLSIYEAVTLASIVQREAIVTEEMPLIASVFLNRLAIQMKLDADPTVQYALGYTQEWGWWKSPLALSDLKLNHSHNTYVIPGLPPSPIANPGIDALRAVAFPETTGYYYFRAACDNSGRHDFSVTFAEHAEKDCSP